MIQSKWNYTWINYNHDNIAIRSHMMMYDCVWNLILGTKFSSICLAKGENVLLFDYHMLTCSVRNMVLICLMQNIDMWYMSLYILHMIATGKTNNTLFAAQPACKCLNWIPLWSVKLDSNIFEHGSLGLIMRHVHARQKKFPQSTQWYYGVSNNW